MFISNAIASSEANMSIKMFNCIGEPPGIHSQSIHYDPEFKRKLKGKELN
jgi:hypothetical protein